MAKRLSNESSIADVLKEFIHVNKLEQGMDKIDVEQAWKKLMGNGVNAYTQDVILKGTRVDGIYTADPEKDKTATKYETIKFDEVYSKGLEVMDMTAFTLCKENNLPIIVFDMNKLGNLKKLVEGNKVGTLVEM